MIPKRILCARIIERHSQIGGIVYHAFSICGDGVEEVHDERNKAENEKAHSENGFGNHRRKGKNDWNCGKYAAKQNSSQIIKNKGILSVFLFLVIDIVQTKCVRAHDAD